MSLDHEDQLEVFFNQALDLNGEAREAFYKELASKDTELAERLRAMADDFEGMESKLSQGVMPLGALANLAGQAGDNSFLETTNGFNRLNPLPSDTMPEQIGPYKVLGKIGEGGMGLVYLVEQQEPKRQLALKLLSQARMTTEMKARFQAEYQTQAIMRHPNIAAMHESGISDRGEIFFTMEYIKGWSITDYCREKRLGLEARLGLFMQVCDGITHAHQKSVMHRDLKPTNILVTEESGSAQVKIIDFGIAKIMEETNEREYETRVGALVGTLEYMSSEQLSGSGDVDTRSDVFSLGVVLYEMLSGVLPRRYRRRGHSSAEEVLRFYREAEAVRPGVLIDGMEDPIAHLHDTGFDHPQSLRSILREELDWVPLKAMALDPKQRYQSPEALKADLQRFLDFEPVQARPPGLLYRSRKFLRRNLLPVALVSVIVLAVLGGVGLLLQSNRALAQAKSETEANLRRYKATNEFLQKMLSAPDPRNQGVEARVIDVLLDAEKSLDSLEYGGDEGIELKGSVHQTLGITYRGIGQYDKAEKHFETALAYFEGIFPENDLVVLKSRYYLYDLYVNHYNRAGLEDEISELISAQENLLGEYHPDVFASTEILIRSFSLKGDIGKGATEIKQLLIKMQEYYGEDNMKLVPLYRNLTSLSTINYETDYAYTFADRGLEICVENGQGDSYDYHFLGYVRNSSLFFYTMRLEEFQATERSSEAVARIVGRDNFWMNRTKSLGSYILELPEEGELYSERSFLLGGYGYGELMIRLGLAYKLCGNPISEDILDDVWQNLDMINFHNSTDLRSVLDILLRSETPKNGWQAVADHYLNLVRFSGSKQRRAFMEGSCLVALIYTKNGMYEEGQALLCQALSTIEGDVELSESKVLTAQRALQFSEKQFAYDLLVDVAEDGQFPHKNEAQYLLYKEFGVAYEP